MPIMEIHDITIQRYTAPTKVKGKYTTGAPVVIAGKGHIQPLDFVEIGAETVLIQSQGDDIKHMQKLYTYIEIQVNDRIIDIATGNIYRVMKVYPYYRYGLNVDHYKSIMIQEDN